MLLEVKSRKESSNISFFLCCDLHPIVTDYHKIKVVGLGIGSVYLMFRCGCCTHKCMWACSRLWRSRVEQTEWFCEVHHSSPERIFTRRLSYDTFIKNDEVKKWNKMYAHGGIILGKFLAHFKLFNNTKALHSVNTQYS